MLGPPTLKAGTTAKAFKSYDSHADAHRNCVFCYAAGTFTCGASPSYGWDASYDEETVTIPPEAHPGLVTITVRTDTIVDPCEIGGETVYGSAYCKHLSFFVDAPGDPNDPPGTSPPSCP